MKKLKRIFCFLLALILVLGEPDIAEAYQGGRPGMTVSAGSAGSYPAGSRDSWAYRMGIIQTPGSVEYNSNSIYVSGKGKTAAEIDHNVREQVVDYFNKNIPVMQADACVYTQVHSNQNFKGGEEKWGIQDYTGNVIENKIYIDIGKSDNAELNPYAEALFYALNKSKHDVTDLKGHTVKYVLDELVKKYPKPGLKLSKEACRDSISRVLTSDADMDKALKVWSGATLSKRAEVKFTLKNKKGRGVLVNGEFIPDQTITSADDVELLKLYTQAVAYLGAMLTIYTANTQNKTHNRNCINDYLKIFFQGEITDYAKTNMPIIMVESMQPVIDNGKGYWVSPTDHFIYQYGSDMKKYFETYDKELGKHDNKGNYFTTLYNIHKYAKKDKKGCCATTSGFPKNCYPRWFKKRLKCNTSSEETFWTDGSSAPQAATQAMRIRFSTGMYTYMLAGSPPACLVPEIDYSYNADIQFTEKGTVDAVKKGYASASDGIMTEHKNNLQIRIDFKTGKSIDSAKKNRDKLLKDLKDSVNNKVRIEMYVELYGKYSKNKLSSDKIKYSYLRNQPCGDYFRALKGSEGKGAVDWQSNIDAIGNRTEGASVSGDVKYKCTNNGSYKYTGEGVVMEMSYADFKRFSRLRDDGTSEGYVTIKNIPITADLSSKLLDLFSVLDMCITTKHPGSSEYSGFLSDKSNVAHVTYKARVTPPGETPDITFESTVPEPRAEIKCGSISDSGANEPFEAMQGFPTTRNLYFASGGNEYVVQMTYKYQEKKNGFRTYTQDTETARSSLTIPYTKGKVVKNASGPGPAPAPLKATCPNCGHKIECKWFAVKINERRWDWSATANVTCNGHPGPKGTIKTHSASDTKTTSDSEKPGPPAVAKLEGKEAKVEQSKVKATAWDWEWRNYGHANDYNYSDKDADYVTSLTKEPDRNVFSIGKSETTTNTLNSKYTNNVGHINNASESNVTMPNSTQFGIIAHKQSWNQPIKDFNYAKITDCKVWKLTEAKVKGTYELTEQDEITATVKSVDDSHLYNIAETDTAKDGRFWHDQKPGDQDEYMFNTFNPNGYCEFCVEYEAGKFLKDQNPQDIKNNTTCISDYLILRTSKGDLSMLYFDYDCKNTTVPVGVVTMKDPKNGGSYKIKSDPVKFTDQNDRATYKKICTENTMTHYGIELPDDGITFGGYNGAYYSPTTKYVSTSKFTQNVDIPSLTISKDTYSKYEPTQEPNKVFQLVRNDIDVPDWQVSNGEYYPYDSSVFYKLVIDYDKINSKLLDTGEQPEYGNQIGAVIESTYSATHNKINNVVVHNPVTTKYAKLIPLDSSRDQRTTTSKIDKDVPKEDEKCSGDPSSCPYSHLHCEYKGNEYHDKTCYEDAENTIFGPPAEMDIPDGIAQGTTFDFDYTGSMQSVILPAGAYKLEAWGAQGVNKGGKGGYSSGNITLSSTQTLYVGVGGQGAEFNGGHATSNKHSGSGGATHIGYKNAQLSSYSSDYSSQLLLVAGGGGGSENRSNWSGGAGGGANQNGADGVGGYPNRGSGHGGTLSKGGEKGVGNYSSSGTFGVGGTNTAGNKSGGAMGGGGFYGGGAGGSDYSQFNDLDDGSGGGGSGYANTSLLTGISGSTGDKEGSGHVRITYTSPSTDKGLVADFDYTGKTKKMTLQNGVYKFEVWGAQGGDGSSTGGKGGYSSGTFTVSSPTDIYITVGAKGNTFNGGGKGNGKGANGGGASHIALVNGQLSTLSSNKDSILLVAGGGGGAQAKGAGSGGGANQNGTQGTAGFGTAGKLATLTDGYAFGQGGPSLTGTDNNYGGAGGGGYYGGGGATSDGSLVDDKGGAGGSGYANTSKIRDIYGETGVHEGDGHIRITALSSPQTVTFKELTCTEVHHSANTNWHYYVIGWEKENGSVISGFEKVSGKIRPRNTTEWFDTAKIKSDLVLIKADDEYKLAKRANPSIDLETGQPQTIEKYTTNGTTYRDCIWDLTDVNGASIHTKSSRNLNHHYSFGDDICWDPCNNDNNHKSDGNLPAFPGDTSNSRSGTFLNLDYGFQIYFPNLGDFYGNGAYGVAETSDIEGKGYYGTPGTPGDEMDTTEWLRNKYVVFNFDVIYDRNKNGVFSDDNLYLAGEPVPLGSVDPSTKLFIDDQPSSYIYNFYIPMEQDEKYNTSIQFCAVANNAGGDMWGQNYDTQNYDRYEKAAKHDAYKIIFTDLVGRIGGLTMVDTGDFRFANTFKQTLSGWLVDNIVHKVNVSKQNMFMADPITIRGEESSDATNGLNTYGAQDYKQDLNKLLTFPLVPAKNNIQSLQKQPQRIGYMNYLSVETVGNYYGENSTDTLVENGGKHKLQVTPFYYHLDLNTEAWTPVDAYMLVDGVYKRIAEFGSTEATTDYEWFYRLNWQEESGRRLYSGDEMATTNNIISNYGRNEVSPSDQDQMQRASLLIPSGKDYIYGTANRLFLKNKNRTFIGSTLTESVYTNPGERIPESKFQLNAQRWHFHLGLPSSTVFVPRGMQPTQENIAKCQNSHSVVVCAIDILASGEQWVLKYDGVPVSEQKIQILPGTKVYNYAGNSNGPGDKRIVSVYSTNRSSKDDLNTQGTH